MTPRTATVAAALIATGAFIGWALASQLDRVAVAVLRLPSDAVRGWVAA